jgi:hypothetical protein
MSSRKLILAAGGSSKASPTVSPELAAIREALWPGGNMEAVWSPDTIDQVARIARPHEQGAGNRALAEGAFTVKPSK